MSNYVPRPNSGTLWPNRKKSDNHPDVRGDVYLDRKLIQSLMSNTDEELIKISVAGWAKQIAGKDCVSLAFSEPYEPKEAPARQQTIDESDVPF